MSENLRILQIFNRYLESGGEEASVQRVYNSLQSISEIRQCLFDSKDWLGAEAPGKISQALRMFYNPDAIQTLRSCHQEHQSTVWLLHNLFPVGSAGIYREARKRDVPLIQYIHNFRPFSVNGYLWANGKVEPAGLRKKYWPEICAGSWQHSKAKTAWYAGVIKYLHVSGAFEQVQAWVAISDFMRKTFVEAGVPEEKVFHIPHSWEIHSPKQVSVKDQGYYLFLGRLSDMKGVRVLMDVWSVLKNQLNAQTPRLVIAGAGPLEEEVQAFCRDNPFVRYAGKVTGDHKTELLRECRAMIAPSVWWEPLGLVTYEAYEHQKPMLAAASGGLTETVMHDRTGFLHEPGNVGQLTEQILYLEKSPEEGLRLGNAGREWLEGKTNKNEWIQKFQAVLAQIN